MTVRTSTSGLNNDNVEERFICLFQPGFILIKTSEKVEGKLAWRRSLGRDATISAVFLFSKRRGVGADGFMGSRCFCCDVDGDPVFPQWDLWVSYNTAYVSTAYSITLNRSSWQLVNFEWMR